MKRFFIYLSALCLLTFTACKKGKVSKEKKGYTLTTAYKNSLTVPVEIQFGKLKSKSDGGSMIEYPKEKITIAAGKSYEKPEFVCTQNCGTKTTVGVVPVSVKFKLGDREKVDTLCKSFFLKDGTGRTRCEKDTVSFYNGKRWKDTKDAKGRVIVRHEYIIDAKDLAEAK